MGVLKRDGRPLPYELLYTENKKLFYTSLVQEGRIFLYVPQGTDQRTAECVLAQRFYNYYYKLHPEEWHVVHFLGRTYHAECRTGKRTGITLEGDRMLIRASKDTPHAYRCVLLAFFAREVERVLVSLMYDAQHVFSEIKFPQITVKSLRGYLGYNYGNGKVILSPQIARYGEAFIKELLYHELCHSLVHGHGADFGAMLEKKHPGGAEIEKERHALAYECHDYL